MKGQGKGESPSSSPTRRVREHRKRKKGSPVEIEVESRTKTIEEEGQCGHWFPVWKYFLKWHFLLSNHKSSSLEGNSYWW